MRTLMAALVIGAGLASWHWIPDEATAPPRPGAAGIRAPAAEIRTAPSPDLSRPTADDWPRLDREAAAPPAGVHARPTEPRPADTLTAATLAARWSPAADGCELLLRVAWILATAADPRQRDAAAAQELAEAALQEAAPRTPWALEVLAAARAEAGAFQDAVAISLQALEEAQRRDADAAEIRAVQQRMQLYHRGNPFREAMQPAADLLPSEITPSASPLTGALLLLADQLEREGQPQRALAVLDQLVALRPRTTAAYVRLGRLHYAFGRPVAAVDALHKAVLAQPEDAPLWFNLAVAYSAAGDLPRSAGAYRAVLRLSPSHRLAANNLAWILATAPHDALRDGQEAMRILQAQQVTGAEGSLPPEVLDTLAAVQAELGRFDEAADTARRAEQRYAALGETAAAAQCRHRAAGYQVGRAFRDRGAPATLLAADEARGHVQLGRWLLDAGHAAEAAGHFEAALAASGNDLEAGHQLAVAYGRQGRTAEAIVALAAIVHRQPLSRKSASNLAWILATSPDRRLQDAEEAVWLAEWGRSEANTAWRLGALAAAQARAEQFDEAAETLREALRRLRDGRSDQSHQFGEYLQRVQNGLPIEADPPPDAPPATDEDCARAIASLATMAFGQGRVDSAMRLMRRALQLAPRQAEMWYDLAQAAAAAGRRGEAAAGYRQALALKPDLHEAANNLAWLLATGESVQPSQAQEAVRLAESLCRIKEPPAHWLDTLAAAYAAQGRFKEARRAAASAVQTAQAAGDSSALAALRQRLDEYTAGRRHRFESRREPIVFHPVFAGMHHHWALALVRSGDARRAERHLRGVLHAAPTAEAWNDLGELLRRNGRTAEASEAFRAAIAMNPQWLPPANNLAWTLAACSTDGATQAVVLAEDVCSRSAFRDPNALDTLAVAYAALGQFDRAIGTARTARHLAELAGHDDLARQIDRRLRLFAAGKPYRE